MSEEANIINHETTASNGNNSWLASLPEDIRKSESLGKFKDVSPDFRSFREKLR